MPVSYVVRWVLRAHQRASVIGTLGVVVLIPDIALVRKGLGGAGWVCAVVRQNAGLPGVQWATTGLEPGPFVS